MTEKAQGSRLDEAYRASFRLWARSVRRLATRTKTAANHTGIDLATARVAFAEGAYRENRDRLLAFMSSGSTTACTVEPAASLSGWEDEGGATR
jgi:hypothetical protein